jgi:pimeloyl-ACP methyl ester carboxylesterase
MNEVASYGKSPEAAVPALPNALKSQRNHIDSAAGRLGFYHSAPTVTGLSETAPLLLIHSVNAAASSFEVKPLFEHYKKTRPVFALDLPGFGISERSDLVYDPRMMTDAIHTMLVQIQQHTGVRSVDVVALSLGGEFAARAALENPSAVRTLTLVSPTGFAGRIRRRGPAGSTRAIPLIHSVLSFRLWAKTLFRLLTSAPSVRFFLRRTWGSGNFDRDLLQYDLMTARQPGAHFAPFRFMEGRLFSDDINDVYEALSVPTLLVHGIRGAFSDFRGKSTVTGLPNWRCTVLPTGAFPHFEAPVAFQAAFDSFLSAPQRVRAGIKQPAVGMEYAV